MVQGLNTFNRINAWKTSTLFLGALCFLGIAKAEKTSLLDLPYPSLPSLDASFSPLFSLGVYGSEPENRFLIDGTQGFISGREFYQRTSDNSANNFIWQNDFRLPMGPKRSWQDDTLPLIFKSKLGGKVVDKAGEMSSLVSSELGYEVVERLRLHIGADKQEEFKDYDRPAYRQINGGGAYTHRGAVMVLQGNAGYWWMASPVSGRIYPWEGYNTELLYKVSDEFILSLVDQELDTRYTPSFYRAHWSRSELKMSFPGRSRGNWNWRLDFGYQRRQMSSDSLFNAFIEQSYPTQFQYHQMWQAPDSIPLQMISKGSLGIRDRVIAWEHTSEFKEKAGSFYFKQSLKGYYRYTMEGYKVPTENFPQDSSVSALSVPGQQTRGGTGELEIKKKNKQVEFGVSANYAMEWELPLFNLQALDTLNRNGTFRLERHGGYAASDFLLQNASVKIFARGGFGSLFDSSITQSQWFVQVGWRDFWGHDAGLMEFKPSEEWVGSGVTAPLPWNLEIAMQLNYLTEKEIRTWGPIFKVPAHLENEISLSQEFFNNEDSRLKLTASVLHTFGEEIREQPNGNTFNYRVIMKVDAAF